MGSTPPPQGCVKGCGAGCVGVSFALEAGDGVHAGGLPGGLESEDEAGGDGGGEAAGDGDGGDQDAPLGEESADPPGGGEAERDAEDSPGPGQDDGFDEELAEDVALAGPEGAADGDFAAALGDGDEHDVHDADSPDDQRDAAHRAEQQGEDSHLRLHPGDEFLGGDDLEFQVRGAGGEVAVHGGGGIGVDHLRGGARDNHLDLGVGAHPQRGGEGDEDGAVGIDMVGEGVALGVGGEDPDDGEQPLPDFQHGADAGIGGGGLAHRDCGDRGAVGALAADRCGDLRPEDGEGPVGIEIGDEPAAFEGEGVEGGEGGGDALHLAVAGPFPAVAERVLAEAARGGGGEGVEGGQGQGRVQREGGLGGGEGFADHHEIGAERGKLLACLFPGDLAQGHHGDDGGDADHHADHAEAGAQPRLAEAVTGLAGIGPENRESADRHQRVAPDGDARSDRCPSWMRSWRGHWRAMSGSWVMMIAVRP